MADKTDLVRQATADDIRAIARLHVASFRSIYQEILPATALATLDPATRARIWAERLEGDGELLVAATGDTLLGFVWLGPTTDRDDDPATVGQVRSIHVSPAHTGQGIGQALLTSARNHLRRSGFASATLWVVADNTRARRVYLRDGWQADGTSRREPLGLPGEDMPLVRVVRFRRLLASGHGDEGARATRIPKYYTVKQQLRRQLEGAQPGTPLPPERTLSAQFGASRGTVRQALLELAVEGLIVRMQGRGTFVAPPKETLPLQLRSYTEQWLARGRVPGSRLVEMHTEPAELTVAQHLGIEPGAAVLMVERLRLAEGTPMALEIAYLEAARFGGLAGQVGDDVSLYELLQKGWDIKPHSAEQTIETVLASPQVAGLLETEAGTPLILLTRTTRDSAGQPFEFVRSVYRGDRYRLVATLSP